MRKDELQNYYTNDPKSSLQYIRNNSKRHCSFRFSLCENKETQLKNLEKFQNKNFKRHSVMLGQSNFLKQEIFNFEKEEADEEDSEDDDIIEEEKNNDSDNDKENKEQNPIDNFNQKKEEEKKESMNKEEKEKKEEEEEDEEEDDDEPDYFNPLNENGELIIPLKTKNIFKKEDFEIIAVSGKGAYGTVLRVKIKGDESNKFYAIKTMDIMSLDRIKKLYQAYLECDILSQLSSPYIVDILGAFVEKRVIYIVMEYISKGDFSDFIRLNYPLKSETIQFYSAEIVSFLSYIQSKNIVHRDLKPENIMMNEKYHLQVIDFATARILGKYFDKKTMEFKDDTNNNIINDKNKGTFKAKNSRRGLTFVGTAEYVSPEVLGDNPAGFGADIWTLGIMIYQMYCGKTPFKEKTNYLIFRKIEQLKIEYPENVYIPEEAKDLISKILVKDPQKRLGAGEKGSQYDIEHLKKHPYFKGIDWDNLNNIKPPNSENFDFLMNKNNKNNIEGKKIKNTTKTNNIKNKDNLTNSIKSHYSTHINIDNIKKFGNLFDDDENKATILKEGYLDKKSSWFHYNKRKVILYSTPKIVYIDPFKNLIRGEIYLDKSFKIVHINMNIFDLICSERTFRFRSNDGEAMIWEKSINDAIKQYSK